jgi:hypothetical protein
MHLSMLEILFILCLVGLFAKRGSWAGKTAGNLAVVGVVLFLLFFAALFALTLIWR